MYFEVKDKDQNQVSKCGLSDGAAFGHCEINANTCLSYLFDSSHDTPWSLHRGNDTVWSGKNGEACLSCDSYYLSSLHGTLHVVDAFTSETQEFSCTSSSSSDCVFHAGVPVDIQVHAGEFFEGEWQKEIAWEIFDSSNHNYVVSGGSPQEIQICVREGDYEIDMSDTWADGWHGNRITLASNGHTFSSCTMTEQDGTQGSCNVEIGRPYSPTPTPTPSSLNCTHGTLSLGIVGDIDTSIWSLETINDGTEVMYGRGIDAVSKCLPCGMYTLRVLDGTSVVSVKDSLGRFVTSCSTKHALHDTCLVEVGRQVRFFVHNSTVVNSTGMGQYHEEISFDLYDSEENLVLSGDAPFDESICLERGMHNLKMTDSWGDGTFLSLFFFLFCLLLCKLMSQDFMTIWL